MEIIFDKKYLEELYYNGKTTDKKHRFQPQIAKKYKTTIDTLRVCLNFTSFLLLTIKQVNAMLIIASQVSVSFS